MVVSMKYLFTTLWYCVCILSCIDTNLLGYACLSQALFPSVIGLLMIIIFGIFCLYEKRVPYISIAQLSVIGLAAYILLHGLIIDPEIYKQGYIVSTLLLMVVLCQSTEMCVMENVHLEYGIILISAINIIYLLAQTIGILESDNPFFEITGTTDNPNTAAIALTISIPFVIQKIKQKKHVNSMCLLFVLMILFIFVLKCRTAYLGCSAIILYLAIRSPKIRQTIRNKTKTKFGIFQISCVAIVLLVLSMLCYNWKKESADGRLFIWQRDCEMIADNPLGCGYGKYEVEYNLHQSRYFSSHRDAYLQSNLTTASGSAYNDIIEHGVQGGILGGALYLIFLLFPAYQAHRNKKNTCAMALVAVVVMSMTNSVYCGISPWIITISAMAIGIKETGQRTENSLSRYVIIFGVSLISIILLYRNVILLVSQSELRAYKDEQNYNIEDIRKLYPAIGTSELYWRYRAKCNEQIHNDIAADSCYTEATKYTSAPLLLYRSAICKEHIGNHESAIEVLKTAVFMLPKNFSLKYHLMMMYDRLGYKSQARIIAGEIISTPEKIHNENVHFIKTEAENYLNGKDYTRIIY